MTKSLKSGEHMAYDYWERKKKEKKPISYTPCSTLHWVQSAWSICERCGILRISCESDIASQRDTSIKSMFSGND